jgi:hypothetical protein
MSTQSRREKFAKLEKKIICSNHFSCKFFLQSMKILKYLVATRTQLNVTKCWQYHQITDTLIHEQVR